MARIYCFGGGYGLRTKKGAYLHPSADLMTQSRTGGEALLPIDNPTVHEQVLGQIMVANLRDNQRAGASPRTAPASASCEGGEAGRSTPITIS